MIALEAAETAGSNQRHQVGMRELTADNELSISERADREFEKLGDDGLLLAGERAGDRKFDGRVIRGQRDQRCGRFEAARAASGDDRGDIPIDGAAELADRLAGDAPAKVAAPLIKIKRQEKRRAWADRDRPESETIAGRPPAAMPGRGGFECFP